MQDATVRKSAAFGRPVLLSADSPHRTQAPADPPRADPHARISRRQLHRVRCEQPTPARFEILKSDMKIFDLQFSNRGRHPPLLVASMVHRTALSNRPANRHRFVETRLVARVAGGVWPAPSPNRERDWLVRPLSSEARKGSSPSYRRPRCGTREVPAPVRPSELAAAPSIRSWLFRTWYATNY